MGSISEPQFGRALLKDFQFRPGYVNLNHGSFGTCPKVVKEALLQYQAMIEEAPDKFIRFEFMEALFKVRQALAAIINADPEELAFVQNATTGVNTVLRSFEFGESGGIVYFSTIYGACGNTVEFVVDQSHGRVFSHEIPLTFPCEEDKILEKFEEALKSVPNLKLAVFDHITSIPGIKMPWLGLIKLCKKYDIFSLVDAAHGIGHTTLDVHAADPDFLVSNCHKWLHSMRATAIMYVPKRSQSLIHSTPISHGYVSQKKKREQKGVVADTEPSAFEIEFRATGTIDYAPFLAITDAIEYRKSIGGEAKIMDYTTELAQTGGFIIAEILGTEVMAGPAIGMTNVRLPIDAIKDAKIMSPTARIAWFFQTCADEHNLAFAPFVHDGIWWGRFCAQIYTEKQDFEYCGRILARICAELQVQHDGLA